MQGLLKWLTLISTIYFVRAQVVNPIECSQGLHRCGDNSKCVADKDLCDYNVDCNDYSDENFAMCKVIQAKRAVGSCQQGQMYSESYCRGISDICSNAYYRSSFKIFCDEIKNGLNSFGEIATLREEKSKLKEELQNATSLQKQTTKLIGVFEKLAISFNETLQQMKNESTGCPPLYVEIDAHCVALFTVAQVSWYEAKQFCESISGTLGVINNLQDYDTLLKHLKNQELETNFWIGGYFNESKLEDVSNWKWLDKRSIPLRAPYWSLRFSSNCTIRGSSEGCYNYSLAPQEHRDGFCLAMDYQYHYYFSDENCHERRSPLCFLKHENTDIYDLFVIN